MVIMDVLNYIREFFSQGLISRKRRAQEEFEPQLSTKYRKVSSSKMSAQEDCITLLDDLVSNSSSNSVRRRSGPHMTPDMRYRNTKPEITINLDDEDDDVIIMTAKESLNRKPSKFTSTPNYLGHRSNSKDDDVTFLRTIDPSPENRMYLKKRNSDYNSRQYSGLNHSDPAQNGTHTKISQNGTSSNEMISPIYGSGRQKQKSFRRCPQSTSPAYRLHEKKIYKQLLLNAAPNLTDNLLDDSFTDYGTPIGKLFEGYTNTSASRGKKMVDLCRSGNRSKPVDFVDLTGMSSAAKMKYHSRPSPRDTIKRVIDSFDNDPIVVNSDSSDIELLPTPPSPKPDFKVERVNSLKTFVDPSEPVHEDWVENLLRKHNEVIARRKREIEEQSNQRLKLNEINTELKTRRLEDEVRRCLKIKETLLPIELHEEISLPILSDEQENMVARALSQYADDNEILARKFNLNISRRDMRTLSGLNWLNDEVINFYMNLIMERSKDSKWPSVYAMNTFFYPKLLKDGHSSIRRWTRRTDIFAHDMIVVPIHLRMHWCMAIIDFRDKRISYYDSMGNPNRLCLESLLKYLQEEHLDKKDSDFDTSGWELINEKHIPQQMNGSDCGMFSCTFAEFLSRDAKITFSQEDMPYLRRKMVVEIMEGRLLIC